MTLDAVILAGGVPRPGEPLYEETRGRHKALLDIGGRPMLQWVLDAVSSCRKVGRVIVIGLPEGTKGFTARNLTLLSDQGGIIENLSQGVHEIRTQNAHADRFLAVSSDIPALRPSMVEEIIESSMESDIDIFFNVIERRQMEAAWPGVPRTSLRLADGMYCAGDLHVIGTSLFAGEALRRFVAWRKSPIKLMAALGPAVLMKMLLNRPGLHECTGIIESRTGIRARAICRTCTEIGMDIDAPTHLRCLREKLTANGNPD